MADAIDGSHRLFCSHTAKHEFWLAAVLVSETIGCALTAPLEYATLPSTTNVIPFPSQNSDQKAHVKRQRSRKPHYRHVRNG